VIDCRRLYFAKIQLFKEKLSKPQPGSSQSRDEQIALNSVKDPLSDPATIAKVANRLPPPVVIRRKQIPSFEAKQQDSSVSDEGARSGREEPSEASDRQRKRRDRGHSRRDESEHEAKAEDVRDLLESSLGNDESHARSDIGARPRGKWCSLSKSASTNGTARIFVGTSSGDGTASTTGSSSYERDLQSLLSSRLCEINSISECHEAVGTLAGTSGHFAAIRISGGSTSSDLQDESELSSEERDALIEGDHRILPSSACRTRIPKFGARRRIVAAAASGPSVSKDYYSRTAGDRLLEVTEDPGYVSRPATTTTTTATTTAAAAAIASKSLALQQNVHVINENVHVINETDIFPGDFPSSSQKATSAPTTLSLGRKLTSWTRESKDLLVKSVSSANTLAPTTMTCIKSPRTMSEHLLGQLEVPVTPATAVLGALRVKGGSLREGDRSERVPDVPRQRWSSVRVKGGSTKSLLLENGGPQAPALKGTIRKEVFLAPEAWHLATRLISINHGLSSVLFESSSR